MSFCVECGADHHAADREPEAAAEVVEVHEVTSAEVEIEKIRAEKEIKLAKIAAGIADAERDQELAHERGKAEALESVITPDPEPQPDPEPIVINDVAPEAEPEPTDLPPAEEHQEPQHRPKARGLGMWG